MGKSIQKSVRLTEEENNMIMRACKKQNITASEYMRQALYQKSNSLQHRLPPSVLAVICDVYTYLDAPSEEKEKAIRKELKQLCRKLS